MLVYILFGVVVVSSYMLGGQFGSAWRKYGCLAAVIGLVLYAWKLKYLPLLLICGTVFMGYGEKSWMAKRLGFGDNAQRLAMAAMYGLPLILSNFLPGLLGYMVLTLVWMVHAGSFKIGKKDFLLEDLYRGGALALGVLGVVIA